MRTHHPGRVVSRSKDIPTTLANGPRIRLFRRAGVLREDIPRKQGHDVTRRRGYRLAPEVIQYGNFLSGLGIAGLVVPTDFRRNLLFQHGERTAQLGLLDPRQRLPHEERAHRVDVATYRPRTELQRLAQRRPASHEGIQDHLVLQVVCSVEALPDVRARFCQRAKRYPAEYGPEPGRPPLVDMIQRPVDLLSPALALRKRADLRDREALLKGGGPLRAPVGRTCRQLPTSVSRCDMLTGFGLCATSRWATKRCSTPA